MNREDQAGSGGGPRWRKIGDWAAQLYKGRLPARGEPAAAPLIAPLAVLVLAATVVCAGLAFVLSRQADDYLDIEHRQALRGAIEALQAVAPELSDVEPKLIRILERASGLKNLKFDPDPPGEEREVQSLLDRNGRIVGWFSWEAERPATALMTRLLPFAALIAFGLFGFAGLAIWQLRRLGFLLAKSERRVHKLEHEDPVTGLPKLPQVMALLDKALAARAPDETVALAILDVEGTDEITHAAGDEGYEEVMLEVANRLRQTIPQQTTLGRITDRKFALIVQATGPAGVLAAAEAARDAMSRALWVNQVVQLGASIGYALAPGDGVTSGDLLRRSRLALRAARRRDRGAVVQFAAEMETNFDERRFIKQEMSRALAARGLEIHYQPIVTAEGGAIVGVEALLRWNHATRGYIPPATFVKIAEEVGLMEQLGEFVLRRALADAVRWPNLYVAVNVSPVQVRDRKFVDLVSEVLAENRVTPARLVLEMTENVLIDDPAMAKARLQDLRRLGVRLALDDFGSGYSSLTYLQQLPFDKLKIDRAFVAALDHSANAGVIIQAIVSLGRALGMSVLIEGVETEEQRVLLRLAGCNEMQGYLFARPAPREEIEQLLMQEKAGEGLRAQRA